MKPKISTRQDFFLFLYPLSTLGIFLIISYFTIFSSQNFKSIFYLKKKDLNKAYKESLLFIENNPLNPYAYLNLALVLDIKNNKQQALDKYNFVQNEFSEKTPQFYSVFNQAELQARLNNKDQALEKYQQALTYSMYTKKIKQHIELLFKEAPKQKKKPKTSGIQKEKNQQEKASQKNQQEKHKNQTKKTLSEKQIKAILKEIEKQESRVRARQFQKPKKTKRQGKDW